MRLSTDFSDRYVTWECTTECNYSCSYCWPECHSGIYRWPTPDQTNMLLSFLERFGEGKRIYIDIMGGEPTLWPDLQRFCSAVSEVNGYVTFSSNGSRTVRWWKKFAAPIDNLVFSFHPEYADIDHYIELVTELHNRYRTTVMILYHPSYREKCISIYNALTEGNKFHISCRMKRINSDTVVYENDDIEVLQKSYSNFSIPQQEFSMNMYMNGDIISSPNDFMVSGKNSFTGWNCQLGTNYRYITANGNIYGAACGVARSYSFGNIYDDSVPTGEIAVKCNETFCNCQPDMVLNTKWFTHE